MAKSYTIPQDFLDSQFQGIIAASDGRTYFALACHAPKVWAEFMDPNALGSDDKVVIWRSLK